MNLKMDFTSFHIIPLHKHPEYLQACCDMINEEWPRSETARMMSLQASCDSLPTSLILVTNDKILLGHCKLSKIPSTSNSCFIETVVISKAMRGKKLGTFLMNRVEEYCRNILHLDMIHLSTKGQENFYSKLGYVVCQPISIYGNYTHKYVPIKEHKNNEVCIPEISINNKSSNSPPPPPPPPMPIINNTSTNHSLKTSKTFMYKCLR